MYEPLHHVRVSVEILLSYREPIGLQKSAAIAKIGIVGSDWLFSLYSPDVPNAG